jgi:AraC-like DNA-binding protein
VIELFPGVRVLAESPHPERSRASCFSLGVGRAILVEDGPRAVERLVRGPDAATETFKVMLQLRGRAALAHCGRRAPLEPGDAVLLDGAQPFRLELGPGYSQAVLELPRRVVGRRCQSVLGRAGERLRASEPGPQLLLQTARAIVERLPRLGSAERAPLLDSILALLGSFAASLDAPRAATDQRYARALADLDGLLGDPDLSAAQLARLQGISRRRLDAIFAARGRSAERLIWDSRLERARRDLHDPAFAGRRVIDIALTWGFSSAAHFSRAFRRKYGQSPLEFRKTPPAGPRSHAPGSETADG